MQDNTKLNTLVGPQKEYEAVVNDCFGTGPHIPTVGFLRGSTRSDFLDLYGGTNKNLIVILKAWIEIYGLDTYFKAEEEREPNGKFVLLLVLLLNLFLVCLR